MVSILCVCWIKMATKSYPSCSPGCSRKQKKNLQGSSSNVMGNNQSPSHLIFNR